MLSQRAAGRRVDPELLILLLETAWLEGSVNAAQLSLTLLTALDSKRAHGMEGSAVREWRTRLAEFISTKQRTTGGGLGEGSGG